jgi:hypothetical protein
MFRSVEHQAVLGVAAATAIALAVLGAPVALTVVAALAIAGIPALDMLTRRVRWSVLAMRARAELRDPTGPLLGVLVGLAMLAAGVPFVGAAGAGAVLILAKVAVGAVLPRPGTPKPRLEEGSAAGVWLSRAERAVEAIGRIEPGRESALADRFAEAREGAQDTLMVVRRLAAHEQIVSRVIAGIDPRMSEVRRLETERAEAETPDMQDEIGRAVEAIRDQIAARDRLTATDRTLVARIRTAALGLEGLIARLGEIAVLAQGGASATAYARVAELEDELDALRAGLAEAESLGRATVHELRPVNSAMEVMK